MRVPPPFYRDRSTWTLYLLLGFYSFMLSTFGAFMPFLRLELGLSYTQASQHSSLFAFGLLASSLSADRLDERFGAGRLIWGGAFGMASGVALVLLAPAVGWSLAGFFVMGAFGGLTLIQISAVLSAKHGPNRTRAISEANVLASFCAVLAPLAISATEALGLGWRFGVGVALVYLTGLTFGLGRTPFFSSEAVPLAAQGREVKPQPLSSRYWRFWTTILLCVAAEFGVMFWAVDFLSSSSLSSGGSLGSAAAGLALSGFLLMMLVGRMFGTRVADKIRAETVVIVSLLVALVGFAAYWLGTAAWLQIAGVLLTGLGIANLYPYCASLALGSVTGSVGTASARILLGSGSAILLAPFVLGALADLSSLRAAQGLLPLCLIAALLNVWLLARERSGNETPHEASPT